MAAVRNGDDAAFEELFARYRDRISAYVQRGVGDHARAEDITQEVFISALRRMRDTERPISFKPWIYEIAKNACIDEFRRSRRATEISLSEGGEWTSVELQLPSPDPLPEVLVEERQKLNNLRGAFGGLSENHHRILVMRELEGLSYGEIGKRLGMSRAMVESTLFRARKRLNEEFRELESGQRCERVRSAMDRSELRSMRMLGVRERRQVARHMAYCQQCRQYAWTVGFDASSLKRRSLAQRIAAVLPIGWWHFRSGGVKSARMPSVATAGAAGRLARYSDPLSQVGLGRAVAAAAALALAAAGSGYVVGGSSTHHSVPVTKVAAVSVAPEATAAAPVFLRAIHTATPAQSAVVTSTKPRSHSTRGSGKRAHHRGGAAGRDGRRGTRAGGARTTGPAPSSPDGAKPASAGSSSGQSTSGGRGGLGSVLNHGGSPSTGVRLPSVPAASVPSLQAPSVNAPARLPQPAQGALNVASQAASAATQIANGATQAVGGAASQAVDGGGSVVNAVVAHASGLLDGAGGPVAPSH